ncbi:hypothetical protein NEOC65_000128 [Neochlamydia sp. AcF65]|uniref:hypothetical protein n=1 Tax=Neochlamydia sp. AcF65 TaxID=2795735 RepID=UPI001BC9AAA7|nr:hypothetical protein [Neochlamydia sp. AcF65]MBS4165081.1 hypothetical protein [Neochlamydia sp. AcF65]
MAEPLINQVQHCIDKIKDLLELFPIFEADKGCDAKCLRDRILIRKIFPWIYRRKKPGKTTEKASSTLKRMRWQVEGAIPWLQRRFRRLVVRWERKVNYWQAFLTFSLIGFWID